jgi:hypothetical protein
MFKSEMHPQEQMNVVMREQDRAFTTSCERGQQEDLNIMAYYKSDF